MAPQLSDAKFDAALQQRLRRDPSRFTNIMEHLTASSPASTQADLGASATPRMEASQTGPAVNTPPIGNGHAQSGVPRLTGIYSSHTAAGVPPQGHFASGQSHAQAPMQGQRPVGHNHVNPIHIGEGQGQRHGQVVQSQAQGQVFPGGNAYPPTHNSMGYPAFPPGLPIPGMQPYQVAQESESGVASALPSYRQMPFAPPSTALQIQGMFPHASQMLNGPRTFPGLPLTKGGAARAKSKKADPVEPKFGKTGSMVSISGASLRST